MTIHVEKLIANFKPICSFLQEIQDSRRIKHKRTVFKGIGHTFPIGFEQY